METLITLDGNDEPIPGVAKEVPTRNGGISEDGLTITFNLNPEAKWQDGTQLIPSIFKITCFHLSSILPFSFWI